MIWLRTLMNHIESVDPDEEFKWGIDINMDSSVLVLVCYNHKYLPSGDVKKVRYEIPYPVSSQSYRNRKALEEVMLEVDK